MTTNQRTPCPKCGRRITVLHSGNLRAHNDGTHGPGQAFRRCDASGTTPRNESVAS